MLKTLRGNWAFDNWQMISNRATTNRKWGEAMSVASGRSFRLTWELTDSIDVFLNDGTKDNKISDNERRDEIERNAERSLATGNENPYDLSRSVLKQINLVRRVRALSPHRRRGDEKKKKTWDLRRLEYGEIQRRVYPEHRRRSCACASVGVNTNRTHPFPSAQFFSRTFFALTRIHQRYLFSPHCHVLPLGCDFQVPCSADFRYFFTDHRALEFPLQDPSNIQLKFNSSLL